MDYLTAIETTEKWDITPCWVTYFCEGGRIPGALKLGNLWLIPKDAEKPADGRVNNRRQPKKNASAPDISGESEGNE
ncbi:MAG: DNA-binding protein [Eubacteriaceae bacterium]|nr:DNA-binding protein [Eubacteriaceae bacterium]